MKKTNLFVAGFAVVAALASVASANSTATFFLDARSNYGDILDPLNGPHGAPVSPSPWGGYPNEACSGGKGAGQVILVSPKMPGNAQIVAGNDWSIQNAYLYLDYAAANGVVLSSVGLNFTTTPEASPADHLGLQSVSAVINTTAASVGGSPAVIDPPWSPSGTAISTPFTATAGGIKMVKVPVLGNGTFDSGTGIHSGTGYQLAQITFTGADRNCAAVLTATGSPPQNSTREMRMSVNGLLVTNVNSGGTAGPVDVNFGYSACTPEAGSNGLGNGSVSGTTSTALDAQIIIREKGDYNNDGAVTNADNNPYFAARVASSTTLLANHLTTWLGDLNGDGLVNNADNNGYFAVRKESSFCN